MRIRLLRNQFTKKWFIITQGRQNRYDRCGFGRTTFQHKKKTKKQKNKICMHLQDWRIGKLNNFLVNYRLITVYLLLRVNLDKIMHARWDFDASSARTRRVSTLDKHQNWSASALFCLNSRAQSQYAVVNLIHTRRKQTFCLLLCDK